MKSLKNKHYNQTTAPSEYHMLPQITSSTMHNRMAHGKFQPEMVKAIPV
jgi:hypothetical protein